jgi:predicted dinucleotide-binding enzyme
MASIAVIGSGRIGGTLARTWAASGHAVTLGARDPSKSDLRDLATGIGAGTGPIDGAVRGAEIVVFAIPGASMAATVSELGRDLEGKIVIDAANDVGAPSANSRDAIEAAAPGASYYRAFNTLGWEVFDSPTIGDIQADLFFCGPDGDGRDTVEALVADIGLRPVWVGGAEEADVVDGVLRLWLTLAMKRGHGRRLAFKMITE